MLQKLKNLLDEYDYSYRDSALNIIIDKWAEQKSELRNILSKSQYWDEEMDAIVVKNKTIMRSIDKDGWNTFRKWVNHKIKEIYHQNIYDGGREMDAWSGITCLVSNSIEEGKNTIDLEYLKSLDEGYEEGCYHTYIRRANDIAPLADGQKWSRYIHKFCKALHLDNIVEMREDIYHDSNTGELRVRTKNYGYNYYIALLGDSINPLENNDMTFVLSLNLIDYLTMSFGNNWSSCHTIDKENYRETSHGYEGAYSSGTMSYALDKTTMIAYFVDEKNVSHADRNRHHHYGSDVPYYLRDKLHREVVSYGEEKLYFARVYPDGRDGGEIGLASQMREFIQQIFAECLNVPNMWKTRKGTSICSYYVKGNEDGYTCYADWLNQGDSFVSFLCKSDGTVNEVPMCIGALPICPVCGNEHDWYENITCKDCFGFYDGHCDLCGEGYCEEDGDTIYIDDAVFCCSDCAREAGYDYVWDIGWMKVRDNDEVAYSHVVGEWVLKTASNIVHCEDVDEYAPIGYVAEYDGKYYARYIQMYDGKRFPNGEIAEMNGYFHCSDDRYWHRLDRILHTEVRIRNKEEEDERYEYTTV